jgi:hypothetical protein
LLIGLFFFGIALLRYWHISHIEEKMVVPKQDRGRVNLR